MEPDALENASGFSGTLSAAGGALSHNAVEAGADVRLGQIAESAVRIAAVGQRVARLAGDMRGQAQEQARRAAAIAEAMDLLTKDLEKAVAELRSSSGQVAEALGTVSRIADHTRIISLNASVEAARAGIHGRAFAVVVEEVQRLADRTGDTTHAIGDRMEDMSLSIVRVAEVAGSGETKEQHKSVRNVGTVNQQVRGMSVLAKEQLDGSHSLHGLSDDVLKHAESLLLSVGSFRFEAHAKAQAAVSELLGDLGASIGKRRDCEMLLEAWLKRHPFFELAYVTDETGRQFVDNVGCLAGVISRDSSSCGKLWSDRPWFRHAVEDSGVHCTDLYRSSATRDFCFTISAALRTDEGNLRGVLGADVNFQRLLDTANLG